MLVAEAEVVGSDFRKAEEDVRIEERQSRTCSALPEMVSVPAGQAQVIWWVPGGDASSPCKSQVAFRGACCRRPC